MLQLIPFWIAVVLTSPSTAALATPALPASRANACLVAQGNSPIVPHSVMMAGLLELQRRFPGRIVIGFEEIFAPPPAAEPRIDLGPPDVTLQQALERIRQLDAGYTVELTQNQLLHVHPRVGTADPAGLLDIRLHDFFLPPDGCLRQQMCCYMDGFGALSYTPELGEYLLRKREAWYLMHGRQMPGVAGDFLGDCAPAQHKHPPFHHNITVRDALNLMALRSLQASQQQTDNPGRQLTPKPISWRYRFRPDPGADTGLGGVPVFQTF